MGVKNESRISYVFNWVGTRNPFLSIYLKAILRKEGQTMTHDELLAIIDSWIAIPETIEGDRKTWKTIRAVVELHKGIALAVCDDEACCGKEVICEDCNQEYPCATIQSIEKELQ